MMILNIENSSNSDILEKPNLLFLERPRARGGSIQVFKWTKEIYEKRTLKPSSQDRTRNNGLVIDKFRFKKEITSHWFGNKSYS